MEVIEIKLNNYIGIYHGLGLKELKIDFSKRKNKITIIRGANGSGKSSLFRAINPLPDDNKEFIQGEIASKEISYRDGDTIYKIIYTHGIKNGERDTAKGRVYRYCSDRYTEVEDLNPTGNITSCKEMIYELFNLDSNFIALSQLSSEDRGLADKKPAERKRFISSILNTLSVYNNIYKTLNKRSSVFKSIMNSITTKIDKLGVVDIEKANIFITSENNRKYNFRARRDELISERANIIQSLPDIEQLDSTGELRRILDKKFTNRPNLLESYNIENIKKSLITLEKDILEKEYLIKTSNNDISNLNRERDEIFKVRNEYLTKQLNIEIKEEDNFDNHVKEIEEITVWLEEAKKTLPENNIQLIDEESIVKIISELDKIIFLQNKALEIGEESQVIDIVREGMILGIDNFEFGLLSRLENSKTVIQDLENLLKCFDDYTELVNSRPKECKIDSCQFIKNLIENKAIIDKTSYTDRASIINDIKLYTQEKDNITKALSMVPYLKEIRQILSSINIDINFELDKNSIERYKDQTIQNKSQIQILKEIQQKEYMLNLFIKEFEIFKFRDGERTRLKNIISDLDDKYNSILDKIKISEDHIRCIGLVKTKLEEDIKKTNDLIIDLEQEEKFRLIEKSLVQYRESTDRINSINDEISRIDEEIFQIEKAIPEAIHNINLYKEYIEEYESYKAKYEKVETVKYFSSPTTGIQTIFIESYMNKIISMANQLLELLFNGEFRLLPFVINESEFRIPCSGNGMSNDDISSMSTSQICMISMILSFALLFHSSTRYNILKLDEIDAGLDTMNRLQFIKLLDIQMEMLACEQCIMISHNTEIDYTNIDIIQLKKYSHEKITEGNIIYQFN